MSRPGRFSTEVAGIEDIAGDMVGLDVGHNICLRSFFSTNIAKEHGLCSISVSQSFFRDRHHGIDLTVQLIRFCIDQGTQGGHSCGV